MERYGRLQSFSMCPSGSPGKGALHPGSSTELVQRETLHLQCPFQPYLKVRGRWDHYSLPDWAPLKRDVSPQSLSYITFSATNKGAPPPGSPNRGPIERDTPQPEPSLSKFSMFPVDGFPPLLGPPTGPYGERHPSHPSLKVPGKRAPFQISQRSP